MKILVTSGPTREPIDSVRFITNMSSGFTGKTLAETLMASGHDITFLYGQDSLRPAKLMKQISFITFDDLDRSLKKILFEETFDAVLHVAAVSDYSVAQIEMPHETHIGPINGKINSSEEITLRFKRNFKIIDRLKKYAANHAPPLVVAFKLTNTPDLNGRRQAVARLSDGQVADFIVHNDLSERLSQTQHKFRIFDRSDVVAEASSAHELAFTLEQLLRRTR